MTFARKGIGYKSNFFKTSLSRSGFFRIGRIKDCLSAEGNSPESKDSLKIAVITGPMASKEGDSLEDDLALGRVNKTYSKVI